MRSGGQREEDWRTEDEEWRTLCLEGVECELNSGQFEGQRSITWTQKFPRVSAEMKDVMQLVCQTADEESHLLMRSLPL